MRRFLLWTLLGFGLLDLLAVRAWGKPKGISFERMVERSEVIAVARFARAWKPEQGVHKAELELTHIIKGDIKPGKYSVSFVDQPGVGEGDREFVAFFRKGLCWRFAATPLAKGAPVRNSVLHVDGFYDWNAYDVAPGLVTLDQIET